MNAIFVGGLVWMALLFGGTLAYAARSGRSLDRAEWRDEQIRRLTDLDEDWRLVPRADGR